MSPRWERHPSGWRLLPLFLLVSACTRSVPAAEAPRPAPDPDAILLITAQLEGTLEPCGCSASLRGGIARLAALVEQTRASHPHVALLDAGNVLFPSARSAPMHRAQDAAGAAVIADVFAILAPAATVRGPLDRAGATSSPEMPDPLSAGEARRLLTTEAGTAVWAITGVTREQLASAHLTAMRAGADFIVALVPLPMDRALALDWSGLEVPLVVTSGPEPGAGAEENRMRHTGGRHFASPQSRGRSVLRVDLGRPRSGKTQWVWQPGASALERELEALDGRIRLLAAQLDRPGAKDRPQYPLQLEKSRELQARRAALAQTSQPSLSAGNFTTRFVALDPTLPESAAVTERLLQHAGEVSAVNLAWSTAHGEDCPEPASGRPSFVGTQTCAACHPEATAFWETTRHARAWKTLVDVRKQGHLDCVGCHLVGWQQPGGVCRLDRTEGWTDVGCESCHGPGSAHIVEGEPAALIQQADARACATCHNAEHSPNFDLRTWLPRVVGPGHGAPSADAGTSPSID